ncbi:alpha/beta hydrolase family protein, partial [Sandarakinorhabdus rubra]|uniref:alpha/beta hydrolase family protein n=1 Tax=Sandarakinorhabdus rubra TaxID=2672568 RepID=UPI0038B4DDB8
AAGWAAAGIAVIQLEHPGSDAAVYAGATSAEERLARVRAAATPAQLVARAGDVGFVADELARRSREGACDLSRINPDRLGLAGHSMGAWTVQAIAGQRFGPDRAGAPPPLVDRRFRAFIAMSPSATSPAGFADVHRPLLAITGTRDGVSADADAVAVARALAQRTALFAALPADGRKAQALFGG